MFSWLYTHKLVVVVIESLTRNAAVIDSLALGAPFVTRPVAKVTRPGRPRHLHFLPMTNWSSTRV